MRRLAALLSLVAIGCSSPAAPPPPAPPPAPAAATAVAVTIDDLPFVGPVAPGDSWTAATARILAALAERRAPVTGFAVCDRLGSGGEAIARQWLAAGAGLGNHTADHRAVDDVEPAEWSRRVGECKRRLAAIAGREIRWFRFPYLRTGETPERRDAAARALARLGHDQAPVSIDTSEWALVRPYVDALERGDRETAAAIGLAHVDHVRAAALRYRVIARRRSGRDPAHVLLLHANALAADHLGAALDALAAEGFRFVELGEALADAIYRAPDRYAGAVGLSVLYRIDAGAEQPWSWDSAQLAALRARFAGEPLPAELRIDVDLVWRRVADRVWVVTHTEPFSANSLVAEMPDSTLLLADTPATDDATRRLLGFLRARFGPRRLVAINGHFHIDASGGNAAIRAAGGDVYGSSLTARLLREKGAAVRAELVETHAGKPIARRFAETPIEPPNRIFELPGGLELDFGGEPVRVIHGGPAHTDDSVAIFLPRRKVLFGGCMVIGMDKIGYTGHADLARWPAAIRALEALPADVVVPGHGPRLDRDLFAHTLRLLETR